MKIDQIKQFFSRGFIQLPLLIALLSLGVLGTYTASRIPQFLQEREFKKISQESNIPTGTASPEEILIGFKPGTPAPNMDIAHDQIQSGLKKRIGQINVDTVRTPAGVPVQETIERYQNLPGVEYAEPNFLATAFSNPNDPLFNKQWGLKKINSPEAYEISQGGFGPIAIVDTGVDSAHPDLQELVLQGYNTITDDTNTQDDHGHGTYVAGVASAQTNNSVGIASVSYQSTILSVKVLTSTGTGTYSDVSEGIIYATDEGARIINLSLGGSSDSKTLERAVDYALEQGSILVAAAGNTGNDLPVYPAAYSGVLSISASDQNDELASFSSYGSNTFAAAPGVSITSTKLGGDYGQASGTSMAAPHVSGLLALTLSTNPELSNNALTEAVKSGAEEVGSYTYDESGWNPYFGYGRLNSEETLQNIVEEDETSEDALDSDPTAEPTPTEDPAQLEQDARTTRPPQEYSFTFELQGTVEGVNSDEDNITVKLEGGTPNVVENITGNLVTLYTDDSTRIRYQNRDITIEGITSNSRINAKGNITENRLVALEILVQYMPVTDPDKDEPTERKPDTPQPMFEEDSKREHTQPQRTIPHNIINRRNVRGAVTHNFWQLLKEKFYQIFK